MHDDSDFFMILHPSHANDECIAPFIRSLLVCHADAWGALVCSKYLVVRASGLPCVALLQIPVAGSAVGFALAVRWCLVRVAALLPGVLRPSALRRWTLFRIFASWLLCFAVPAWLAMGLALVLFRPVYCGARWLALHCFAAVVPLATY